MDLTWTDVCVSLLPNGIPGARWCSRCGDLARMTDVDWTCVLCLPEPPEDAFERMKAERLEDFRVVDGFLMDQARQQAIENWEYRNRGKK